MPSPCSRESWRCYLSEVYRFYSKILQENGVEVDDRGVGGRPAGILPITRFSTESEVEKIANEARDRLTTAGVGAANLYSVVAEVLRSWR